MSTGGITESPETSSQTGDTSFAGVGCQERQTAYGFEERLSALRRKYGYVFPQMEIASSLRSSQ
jgi:hypothetical protein